MVSTKPRSGYHTLVQYTILPIAEDASKKNGISLPRTETTKVLLQPHITVEAFLATLDRLVASSFAGYCREEPTEVLYYPPTVENSHRSEEEVVSISKGTTIGEIAPLKRRREITEAAAAGAVDAFDTPYIISADNPICLVVRKKRGTLVPDLATIASGGDESEGRSETLLLPSDPVEAADLLIAEELAKISEARKEAPVRRWFSYMYSSQASSSAAVTEALMVEERALQTRLSVLQQRAVYVRARHGTLAAQRASLRDAIARAREEHSESGGDNNLERRKRLEGEVDSLRTEIAVLRQREGEIVEQVTASHQRHRPTSPLAGPKHRGGEFDMSPDAPSPVGRADTSEMTTYDPAFSPAAPSGGHNQNAPAAKYTVTVLSDEEASPYNPRQGQQQQQVVAAQPQQVHHQPRQPGGTHLHRTLDTPSRHVNQGESEDLSGELGDEYVLGSGPPPAVPPREGYPQPYVSSTQSKAHTRDNGDNTGGDRRWEEEHEQAGSSRNPPPPAGSRYRAIVEQERRSAAATSFGNGNPSWGRITSSAPDSYRIGSAVAGGGDDGFAEFHPDHFEEEGAFDDGAAAPPLPPQQKPRSVVDESSWLSPVLKRDIDAALSQSLPLPRYLDHQSPPHQPHSLLRSSTGIASPPPPPVPHVQSSSPYGSSNTYTAGDGSPRGAGAVPSMAPGPTPGSLSTSLSAYLYQIEGGSPQGLRKDLIARLGSRQYANASAASPFSSLSPSRNGVGYVPPVIRRDVDSNSSGLHYGGGGGGAIAKVGRIGESSSSPYEGSRYFQEASPFGGGRAKAAAADAHYDAAADMTPPPPQYRRPSYGALVGGGGVATRTAFGGGRQDVQLPSRGGPPPTRPNFDESP